MKLKSREIPPHKAIYCLVGILMIGAALGFSLLDGFKVTLGHAALATLGIIAVAASMMVREEALALLSRWLIMVNVAAALAFLIKDWH